MILRIFETAVAPDDLEHGKEVFRDEVAPMITAFPECLSIALHVGVEEHSGDLVDIVAISQWESLDAIKAATASEEYARGMTEIRKLFKQTPMIRHFETID